MSKGFYYLITASGTRSIFYCSKCTIEQIVELVGKLNDCREASQQILQIENEDGITDILIKKELSIQR